MRRSTSPSRAVLALSLTIWSQACFTTYRPPPADASLMQGRWVRVRSNEPLPLKQATGAADAPTLCEVTSVEGQVKRAMGDTLVLEHIKVALATESEGVVRQCTTRDVVLLLVTPETEVTVQGIAGGRSTALYVVVVLALVALAGFAASSMTLGSY